MRTRTMQETFDVVARHLLAQGQRSCREIDGRRLCAYRGAGGRKCAVGALIPDGLYDPEMDAEVGGTALGPSAWSLVERWPGLRPHLGLSPADGPNDRPVRLLRKLQDMHDDYDVARWPRQLALVADLFGLSASVVREGTP